MISGRVLIAGCGDLGTRAGLLFAERGLDVVGLRRTPVSLPFETRAVDLSRFVSFDDAFTHLVVALTPDARTEAAYRATYVDAVANLKLRGSPRVLFVSSTSVWGDLDGAWVDESTPISPNGFNGRVLVEAERAIDGVVLRLSGLYGPGKTALIERVRAGAPASDEWTNRIHVDDAAAAIVHLALMNDARGVYIGTDSEPARAHDVADFIADRLGVASPSRIAGRPNKRLSNAKLLSTGFRFGHPDFRTGYASLV